MLVLASDFLPSIPDHRRFQLQIDLRYNGGDKSFEKCVYANEDFVRIFHRRLFISFIVYFASISSPPHPTTPHHQAAIFQERKC